MYTMQNASFLSLLSGDSSLQSVFPAQLRENHLMFWTRQCKEVAPEASSSTTCCFPLFSVPTGRNRMKEHTPLCRVWREYVCLHTDSQGVVFRATEAAQDPSSGVDDVFQGGNQRLPWLSSGLWTQVLPVCLLENYPRWVKSAMSLVGPAVHRGSRKLLFLLVFIFSMEKKTFLKHLQTRTSVTHFSSSGFSFLSCVVFCTNKPNRLILKQQFTLKLQYIVLCPLFFSIVL